MFLKDPVPWVSFTLRMGQSHEFSILWWLPQQDHGLWSSEEWPTKGAAYLGSKTQSLKQWPLGTLVSAQTGPLP